MNGLFAALRAYAGSDSVKRAVRTGLIATLAIFIPGLLGWLNDLTAWASNYGQTPFPDGKNLAYLGVSAVAGGTIAFVNLVWNAVEDWSGRAVLRKKS